MEYTRVLSLATDSGSQGQSAKRYSLLTKPSRKDPKKKKVESTAIQAFLKRKENEVKHKVLLEKKRKDELMAKRVELKHDRKARAMASRTKDNFRGYDGIPVDEKGRKMSSDDDGKGKRLDQCSDEDDYYDTVQFEEEEPVSGQESEEEFEEQWNEQPKQHRDSERSVKEFKPHKQLQRPGKEPKKSCQVAVVPRESVVPREAGKARESGKPKAPKKPPPPPMNFSELLKLAEKKHLEPVEIKVVKKVEEKLRTAEELKELEFLARKQLKQNSKRKPEKEVTSSHSGSSSKKEPSTKDVKSSTSSKSSSEKLPSSKGSTSTVPTHTINKRLKTSIGERSSSSMPCKTSVIEKTKHTGASSHPVSKGFSSNSGRNAVNSPSVKHGLSSSSQSKGLKPGSNGTQSVPPTKDRQKKPGLSASSSGKGPTAPVQQDATGTPSTARPKNVRTPDPDRSRSTNGSGQPRPGSSQASGSGAPRVSSGSGAPRVSSGGSSGPGRLKAVSNSVAPRPGPARDSGPARASSPAQHKSMGSSGSVRQRNSLGAVPGSTQRTGPERSERVKESASGSVVEAPKPKCTVVSETISSKSFVPRPHSGQMRPPPAARQMVRPPGPPKPPLPTGYKRRLEDEEYDSEMEDFIDNGGESQDVISKHIREIFGYDRNKYKDESDYALRYMESSWKEQQNEEAKSLRMGILEDEEELRKEEEELKRKVMRAKRKRV